VNKHKSVARLLRGARCGGGAIGSRAYDIIRRSVFAARPNLEDSHNSTTNRRGCQQLASRVDGQVRDGVVVRSDGVQRFELLTIEQHYPSGLFGLGIGDKAIGRVGKSAKT
jgi:hypothetical protein